MQFKHGAEVVTAQGHRVGSVDRVVMDPNTKEVSAIVVRKGVLFVDDKLVPVSRITSATVNHVTIDVADFDQLPNFIETEYIGIGVPQEEVLEEAVMAEPLYWYPPIGSAMWGYPPMTGYPPELPVAGHKQIPEGLIALHEGARYGGVAIAVSIFNYLVYSGLLIALPWVPPLAALVVASAAAMALSYLGYSRLVFDR